MPSINLGQPLFWACRRTTALPALVKMPAVRTRAITTTRLCQQSALPTLEWVKTETKGRVGVITLNRPKALNALSDALMTDLNSALLHFEKDESIGTVVITGSERAFAGNEAPLTILRIVLTKVNSRCGHQANGDHVLCAKLQAKHAQPLDADLIHQKAHHCGRQRHCCTPLLPFVWPALLSGF